MLTFLVALVVKGKSYDPVMAMKQKEVGKEASRIVIAFLMKNACERRAL